MAASTPLAEHRLWYRVYHPVFSKELAYRAIAHLDFGETAWAYLLFVTEKGYTWSARVDRCHFLPPQPATEYPHEFWRPLTCDEQKIRRESPKGYNPDLLTDL